MGRLLALLVLGGLAGCEYRGLGDTGAVSGSTDADADADADTDADADSDADSDADADADAWRLEEGSRFMNDAELDVGDPPSDEMRWEHGPGLAVADIDGDGDLDAIMSIAWSRSYGFRNNGGVLEIDESITLGGATLPAATSVLLADLDGDGDADGVFTGGTGTADKILDNDGSGVFTSRSLSGSTGMSISPSVGDMDGDGDLDLAIPGFNQDLGDVDLTPGAKLGAGTQLWRNDGGMQFVEVTSSKYPESSEFDLTYHLQFLDFDLDGDLDMYQANDFGGNVEIECELLENDGRGGYTAMGSAAGSAWGRIAAMGAAVGDPNQDGYPDLWVSNLKNQQLLFNNTGGVPGNFLNYGTSAGVQDPANGVSEVGWGARMQDLNGDLLTDIVVTFGPIKLDSGLSDEQPDLLYLGGMDDTTPTWTDSDVGFGDDGVGRTIAHADINRDGRGDLVVVGRTYLIVYYAAGGAQQATLHLDAGGGNHEGIGTRVVVEAGGRSYTTWMLPSVIFGSSAPELYLGLNGEASGTATITWPDGETVTETIAPGDELFLLR